MARSGAGPLEGLGRELRIALRTLRRNRRFAISALLALSVGIGLGVSLLSLVGRGLSHPQPLESPAGIEVPGEPERELSRRPPPSTLAWMLGAGPTFGSARQSVAALQRSSLASLLRTLGATVVLALGVACLNLALLLLARAAARGHEMALRAVLGARRWRLARPLLLEGALLGGSGAALGIILAAAGVTLLRSSWPDGLARWLDGPVPWSALLVAVGLPGLTALGFALAPAVGLARDLHPRLAGGGRTTAGPREGVLRRRLAMAAIAGSLVLVIGAGLLLRGLQVSGTGAAQGPDATDTLTLRMEIPSARYPTPAARSAYLQRLLAGVAEVPGLEAQSLASTGAWVGMGSQDLVHVYIKEPGLPGRLGPARYHAVSPGYFRALGIPVLKGREFTGEDGPGAAGAVVVSETFAHRLLPHLDPLGRQVQLGGMSLDGEFYTIVGVVSDVRVPGVGSHSIPVPAIYLSALQIPPSEVGLAVRTRGDPLAALPEVERAIRRIDPAQVLEDPRPMEAVLAAHAAPLRWFARILGALAVAALALACFGLYGVISYTVAQRTREIGIRMALGAPARAVVGMVLRDGARVTAIGAVAGLAGALCLARLLQFLFYGIPALDPLVYGSAAVLLSAVTLLASYRPARAATRVAPVVALREE